MFPAACCVGGGRTAAARSSKDEWNQIIVHFCLQPSDHNNMFFLEITLQELIKIFVHEL